MLTGPHEARRALLGRVRRSGLDHVFVADHISFFTGFGMDGLIQAATAAALEPELMIEIGVYLLALRHPLPVARQIASFCESAPGRLVFGVGVGGEDRHEIEICGVDPATRGARTDEHLEALELLLRGQPVTHRGRFVSFENAVIHPAPSPRVPIVVGGRSKAAIRRAARFGDGWLGVWYGADRYAEIVAGIEEASEGRAIPRPAVFDHGLQVWAGLDADRSKARERLARMMQGMYRTSFERFEPYCPYGSAVEIADFLSPYLAAGCRHFNVMAVAASSEAAVDGVAEIRERLAKIDVERQGANRAPYVLVS